MDPKLIPTKENGMPWACPRWNCSFYSSCDWSDRQMLSCEVKMVPLDRRSVMSESEYKDYLDNEIE